MYLIMPISHEFQPTPQELIKSSEDRFQEQSENITLIAEELKVGFEYMKKRVEKGNLYPRDDPRHLNLKKFHEMIIEVKNDYHELATTPLEKLIIDIHTELPILLQRNQRRDFLRRQWQVAQGRNDAEAKDRIRLETDKINEEDAAWQGKVGSLMLFSTKIQSLRPLLENFWGLFDFFHKANLLEQEGRRLRYGVTGPVATLYVLDHFGYNGWFAAPHQDARQKIDLWAVPKIADLQNPDGWEKLTLAVQVKTSHRPLANIKIEHIAQRPAVLSKEGTERKDEQDRLTLFTSVQSYNRMYQASIKPIWVNFEGELGYNFVLDPLSGRPHDEVLESLNGTEIDRLLSRLRG